MAYSVSYVIGANLIFPFALYLVALLLAKKSSAAAWTLFVIGGGAKLLSLIGNIRRYRMMASIFGISGYSSLDAGDWIVFVLLSVIFFRLISKKIAEVQDENEAAAYPPGPGGKTVTKYVCRSCGKACDKWQLDCPFCGASGAMETVAVQEPDVNSADPAQPVEKITDQAESADR